MRLNLASVLGGPSYPCPERGTAAPTFRPMSIMATRSPILATAELLFVFILCCITFVLVGECVFLLC